MITKIIGYDIDGVITKGIRPERDAVIVSGRSWQEAPETYKMLHDRGIFNAVYFNPIPFEGKTLDNGAMWKAIMVDLMCIDEFYEDDVRQAQLIKLKNPETIIHLIEK